MADTDHERFLTAWRSFGAACSGTVAPEATYQAWFAHFLIEQFTLLQVVREVDFGSRHLLEADRAIFKGSNVLTDIAVLRGEEVDLPRRAALGDASSPEGYSARSGLGRLEQFAIISELKVGSSQAGGLRYGLIVQDVLKLSAIICAAKAAHADHAVPTAYACVLDNNARHPLNRDHLRRRIELANAHAGVELLMLPEHPAGTDPDPTHG